MRPLNSLKNALFNSLYRASLISTVFAVVIIALLIFVTLEKDMRLEGRYLSNLVFKELREAMNRAASYEQMNELIGQLNADTPGIKYQMYRSKVIQDQFGQGRNLSTEIYEKIKGQEDAIKVESLNSIHYYRNITFEEFCLQCHTNAEVGATAGVLDVSFPIEQVRIPIYEVLLGLFLLFSITILTSYIALSSDLLTHMIDPLRKIEKRLRETEGHHDLKNPLDLDSDLKEILSIEHSFNAQQELLHTAFKELEEVSIYDKLTGTYNRHQLERLLVRETARAMRAKQPLTVAMIDLNGFKPINDTYGHQAGDEILSYFCKLLSDNLRVTDAIIRYGGDEFLVLLPNSLREQSEQLFERIEQSIEQQPYMYKGTPIEIKFSTGTSEFPSEAAIDKKIDLIQIADERMYQNKLKKKAQRVV